MTDHPAIAADPAGVSSIIASDPVGSANTLSEAGTSVEIAGPPAAAIPSGTSTWVERTADLLDAVAAALPTDPQL